MNAIPESQSEDYTIQVTGAVEVCFDHLVIVSATVYVHGAVGATTAGVADAAAGPCYLGRVRRLLTELRGTGYESMPYLVNETLNIEPQPGRLYVNGTAGDIVTMIYRPVQAGVRPLRPAVAVPAGIPSGYNRDFARP